MVSGVLRLPAYATPGGFGAVPLRDVVEVAGDDGL
jgi:hypothetical protein